jgi:hypothetical protein
LNGNKIEELKHRISEHFYNEAKIMRDILKANLTDKETEDLVRYMEKHPYGKFIDTMCGSSEKKEN